MVLFWEISTEYWHQRADERLDNTPQGNQETSVVNDRAG